MIQLNVDCEGPITQNDNAYELCDAFIPNGGRFFSVVSKYDDFLADVEQRPGYKAGDTLRLILPFMKAFGITDRIMEEFSRKTLVLLPGTPVMLPEISSLMPTFIISTSYRPYLEALCKATGFDMANVYCTEVSLDALEIPAQEEAALKELAAEIASMKLPGWPDDATGRGDLAPGDLRIVERLDQIFWQELSSMEAGRFIQEVNPIGGAEKAKSVEDSLVKTGNALSEVVYAGDSITDVQALELVKAGGGMSISFNGNRYAIRAATWACLAPNTAAIGALAATASLGRRGDLLDEAVKAGGSLEKERLLELFSVWQVPAPFLRELSGASDLSLFLVERVDRERLVSLSESYRKGVRGVGVGDLG